MKNISLALFAAIACAAPVLGQNSPAPAGSASLTQEERQRAVDYMKETEKAFLAAVEGVSDAQWTFKPAPDRWSIAETAEHNAVAEDLIWSRVRELMKAPANPEKRADTQGKDTIIFEKIPVAHGRHRRPSR